MVLIITDCHSHNFIHRIATFLIFCLISLICHTLEKFLEQAEMVKYINKIPYGAAHAFPDKQVCRRRTFKQIFLYLKSNDLIKWSILFPDRNSADLPYCQAQPKPKLQLGWVGIIVNPRPTPTRPDRKSMFKLLQSLDLKGKVVR